MVGQSLWKNLKGLVSIDKQLEETISKLDRAEKLVGKDQKSIPDLHSLLEKTRKAYLAEKENVSQQELTAKELREAEMDKKALLEKITNPKEFKAAEKEYKAILQKRMEQDDNLIKGWHNLSEKEKQLEKETTSVQEESKKLEEGIQAQKKLIEDLKAQKDDLMEKRLEAIKTIPQNWLDKYENMRHKVQDPIVPVIDNSCSACYYSVLRQDLNQLKKAGILPCRNCYRFLYYDEEEQQALKKETY